MQLEGVEAILFFLSDGDVSKIKELRSVKQKYIWKFAYKKQLNSLNKIYADIAESQSLLEKIRANK